MDAKLAAIVVKDIRTYQIMQNNKNYQERLYEAYEYIKSVGIKDVDDFCSREGLAVGAFQYTEISIFDRLEDPEYAKVLSTAMLDINNNLDNYINNKSIGDELASWGTLGYTPKREELITKGYITHGLTAEEKARHFH